MKLNTQWKMLFALLAFTGSLSLSSAYSKEARLDGGGSGFPLYFIENQGQVDDEALFYVQGMDKCIYFTTEGLTLDLAGSEDNSARCAVKLAFVDANPNLQLRGEQKQEAIISCFKGKPDEWIRGAATFASVVYADLWPGIDLVYSGSTNELKYRFVIKPGADPKRIRLAYQGSTGVALTRDGELKITTPVQSFSDAKPIAFQEMEGKQFDVSVTYSKVEETGEGCYSYGFDLGAYDPNKTLILDPAVLVKCSYIGGSSTDLGYGIDVDAAGCVYVSGWTQSADFPAQIGPYLAYSGGGGDGFIAKINAEWDAFVYCGYIGGNGNDEALDVAVDEEGKAHLIGFAVSNETTFPVKVGPCLTHSGGWRDAFVAKVNAAGDDLEYCGYIGGSSGDTGSGIVLDKEGNAYVTGGTESDENSFPVLAGPDITHNGTHDCFVAKVLADGTALEYCGYIGGSETDSGSSLAMDSDENIYIVGSALSDESTFPVTQGPFMVHSGAFDLFVAKINAGSTTLAYCGYIGGANEDYGTGIAVDASGSAYVAGYTESNETTDLFPVRIGPDLIFNGVRDAFVAKINPAGDDLIYCGYIGGTEGELSGGIGVDAWGRAVLCGSTSSTEASFPVLNGPDDTHNGGMDVFVARVNPAGDALLNCGYIGGAGGDGEYRTGMCLDIAGDAYITGDIDSDEMTFPVMGGPDLTHNGGDDAFAAKVSFGPVRRLCADADWISAASGGTIHFSLDCEDGAFKKYCLLACVSGTMPGTPLPNDLTLPLNLDVFTYFILFPLINTTLFENFLGTFDATGHSTATIHCGPFPYYSCNLYFAYTTYNPFDSVSQPIAIEIVP
ncbi:MAG: SBBP repeat-containing protein [Planctomycetota bacterium]